MIAEAGYDIGSGHVESLDMDLGSALRGLEHDHAMVAAEYGEDTPASGIDLDSLGSDRARPDDDDPDAAVSRVRDLAGRTAIALRLLRDTLQHLRFVEKNAYVVMAQRTETFHLEVVLDCSEDTPPDGVQIGNDRTPQGARKPWAR